MGTIPPESNVVEFPGSRSAKSIEDTVQAAKKLARSICTLNFNPRIFCETLRSEHAYTQDQIGRVLLLLFAQWADDYEQGNYDLRTQELVETANYLINPAANDDHKDPAA